MTSSQTNTSSASPRPANRFLILHTSFFLTVLAIPLHVKGKDVFTRKTYEDTVNLTAGFHGIDVPVTSKRAFSLMDVDVETGFLSLLTDAGDCKEDVGLSRAGEDATNNGAHNAFDEIGAEVVRRFEAGDALRVTVLSLLGKDVVIGVDAEAEG